MDEPKATGSADLRAVGRQLRALTRACSDISTEQPVTIELRLTRARWEKLSALADAEGMTIQAVLCRFIDACQPGGGGWEAPQVKARRREREERGGG